LQRLSLISCDAPVWANNGHGQTLASHFMKSPTLAKLGEKIKVDLPDGDRLFYYVNPGSSNFVVAMFHGLSGDSNSDYMQRSALVCKHLGHTAVLVNHRGAGEDVLNAKLPYHSGSTDDMSAVLRDLRVRFPNKKIITIGYSLSGNILLSLLGGYRNGEKPDGAITVNAPLLLGKGSLLLKRGFNRLYDVRFVLRLRRLIEEKYQHGVITKRYKVPPWTTLHAFDQIYTAPASGFKDRDDYYDSCSSIQFVDRIVTPTHILTAEDDPFIDVNDYRSAKFSSSCQLHVEKRGGHMGYIAKNPLPQWGHRWLDYYIHEALKGLTDTLT
jgi:predicted alpha/beta-fold hydrolase